MKNVSTNATDRPSSGEVRSVYYVLPSLSINSPSTEGGLSASTESPKTKITSPPAKATKSRQKDD